MKETVEVRRSMCGHAFRKGVQQAAERALTCGVDKVTPEGEKGGSGAICVVFTTCAQVGREEVVR